MNFDFFTPFYKDLKNHTKKCNISEDDLKDFYNAFLKKFKYDSKNEEFINNEKNKVYKADAIFEGIYYSCTDGLKDGDAAFSFASDYRHNPLLMFNYVRGNDYIMTFLAPAKHKKISETKKPKQFFFMVFSDVVPYLCKNYYDINIYNVSKIIADEYMTCDCKISISCSDENNSMKVYQDGQLVECNDGINIDYNNVCSDGMKLAEQYYEEYTKNLKEQKGERDPQL